MNTLLSNSYAFSLAKIHSRISFYGVYLHEEAAMANLEAFAEKLKPHGYEYFVIDAGWFGEFKLQEGTIYPAEKHAKKMNFNEYGLLQPSETYFPNGLQPIIDRCHELGIKFGIHLMRGIPREGVHRDLPVKGTSYTASEIADTISICSWNHQNYGIDMSKPGAQEFHNSLINQMVEWGVDFLKYDFALHPIVGTIKKELTNVLKPGANGRGNALEAIRDAGAIHMAGDQHLATFVQHGIDEHRDGPFAFVAPAIVNTVYRRWWHPIDEQPGKNNDPKNPLPFTGDYIDGFGNKITMHAYANIESEDKLRDGFGIIRFNKKDKSITFESWERFTNVTKRRARQIPGWPRTIRQSGSGQNIFWTLDPIQ